ncbi:MAG: hypothetical protein AAGI92_06195 [Pseudomonadota bacterium]
MDRYGPVHSDKDGDTGMHRLVSTLSSAIFAVFFAGTTSAKAEDHLYLTHPDAADGITLTYGNGTDYRLHGIRLVAPNRTCLSASDQEVDCSGYARNVLERYAASFLRCERKSVTGTPISVICRDFQGRDVAARMVVNGWAEPDRANSQAYIFEAMEAEAHRRGIWRIAKWAGR